jgi:hypothetical protein
MRHRDIDQNHDAHKQPTTRNLETSHLAQQRVQGEWGREWQGMQIVFCFLCEEHNRESANWVGWGVVDNAD